MDQSRLETMKICPVCNQEEGGDITLRTCAGCRSIAYCSREHQKEHWKIHKHNCTPFAITRDPVLGRQWIATKNLKAGTLISEEFSVLYCPQWEENERVCLTCALKLDTKNPSLCTNCGWPICSSVCEKHPVHAENECEIFSRQKIPFSPPISNFIQDSIRLEFGGSVQFFENPIAFSVEILRGLGVKKRDPSLFAELLSEAYRPSVNFKDSVSRQINQLRFFKKFVNPIDLGLTEDDDFELGRFIEASCGNKFTCPDEDDPIPKRATMEGTFIKSTLLNHSCAPNCLRITRPFPKFASRIRTMVPVKKGETLTINYFREGLELEGRDVRLKEIQLYWRFTCKCPRCLDPSELGSFGDGIACDKCKSRNLEAEGGNRSRENFGYFIPDSLLDDDSKLETTKWKCSGCKLSIPYAKIRKRLELQEMEYKSAKFSEQLLEKFVQEKTSKILHPNHHLILAAYRDLVEVIETREMQWRDREEFYKWRERHVKIFHIEKSMAPGISPARGVTIGRFAAGVITAVKNSFINFTEQEKVVLMEESLTLLEEALFPFKYDADVVPSYQSRATAIATIMEKVREVLKSCGGSSV